ncbi:MULTISPECIES: SUMF1/EgtB/PvdO family nonheme iron enzyme [Candidatus Accumulibacter]|nr:SUMF1/EgtB/PvdO family nonheme iron enzyme [Accumulibacter sp.]MBN8518433.1 SUMF1/EgtB/PvdO family nonheme iron enzyme [Accumulibacter sp.]HMW55626.1 SUMF1/EgtB/PvdO family nonheme iron enzyme [Accumulibacter sp.]
MRALLDDPATTPARRAAIDDRLAMLPEGDRRPGVGLRADGVPDIVWHAIPGGEVRLEIEAKGLWKRLCGRPSFRVEPFHIARYPVTVAQWRPFVAAPDGYDALVRQPLGWDPAPQRGHDNQPATLLTWIEAMAYCRWLSGLLGYPVRLPTEWEWQQAASGGEPANDYPWGDWQEGRANTYESRLGRLTAVGLHPAGQSAQGVLDLAGNVWEWCLNESEAPKKVAEGGDARRVVRGGSWIYVRDFARCAYRHHVHPGARFDDVGFRMWCDSPIF